ncbi:hypothetical protein HKX54_02530 [Sulfitobacter sp. M57]|uniref:hypothetical protein n=1 Tax=unclassified Sulfitobacter TaxID=196795 RepID=UPI0023E2A876|nr:MULTISPECIES: hypothetical protein [unclassified Sulfitobacter]MDF3413320.1 hypothetical protein [Sulfitobacter sp. KE5]MDF3421400.1 hypothetical protein [Sulfitobacter sp. KE43]MDF3431867.1 hypothetical protein [Sulfitobacter sp. KE42]MDF3457507.1 hypothetical protein [Sulfitobacter sp. S74]MDF3461409.1 hypothetical protein [Sulfitobacter sp. Ks18]
MTRFCLCGMALAVLPIQALSGTYACTAEDRGSGGWVAEQIFVQIDRQAGSASAYDTFINQRHNGPIAVTLEQNSATVFTLGWKLRNVETKEGGSNVLSQSLLLDTETGRFAVKGRLHGYNNVISGNGSCQLMD